MDGEIWTLITFTFLLIMSLTCSVHIIVEKCPATESAWMARAQIVTCKSPLVYHCIQNSEGKLMETCMIAYRVKPNEEAGCPWASYHTDRGSILGAVFYSCKGNGCPHENDSDYWTNQLYKYPICLHHYNGTVEGRNSTTSSPCATCTEITCACNDTSGDAGVIIAAATTVFIMMILFTVAALIWNYRRRLNCTKRFLIHQDSIAREYISLDGSNDSMEMPGIYRGNGHRWNRSTLKKVDKDGRNVLHNACLKGKTNIVRSLINTSKDLLYIKDHDGCTPFHLAGFSGSVDLVEYLIGKEGCNIRCKDQSGQTIVHHACQAGHINLVSFLIRLDEEILNIKDNKGMSPLHCKDKMGQTIVHQVCKTGNLELIKLFIGTEKDAFEIKNKNGYTPFQCAAVSGSVELVQYLIDNGCDIASKDNTGQTIVHNACQEGHVSLVKHLIDKHKSALNLTDNNGKTPFHYAGFSGSVELVQYLIDNGCDVYSKNNNGQSIVHIACQEGHIDLVKYLIDKDKSVLTMKNDAGSTPFHYAGFSGSVDLVQFLIENGCDIYSKNNANQIIVHKACQKGHINLVKHLIDIDGSLLDMKEKNGYTPFHYAGFSGSVGLVQCLIDSGCDIFSKNNVGRTIAHAACQKGHVSLVKHLIDKDKGVLNIKDNNGLTPIHCAGFSGSVELVQYLIDIGCDVYSTDYTGRSIVNLACDKGHMELVKYIKAINININMNNGQ